MPKQHETAQDIRETGCGGSLDELSGGLEYKRLVTVRLGDYTGPFLLLLNIPISIFYTSMLLCYDITMIPN